MKAVTVTFRDEAQARALQRAFDFFCASQAARDAVDALYGAGTAKAAEEACSALAAAFAERAEHLAMVERVANATARVVGAENVQVSVHLCPYCGSGDVTDARLTRCPQCARRIRRYASDDVGTYASDDAPDPHTLIICAAELDAAARHDHGLIAISKLPEAWRRRAQTG